MVRKEVVENVKKVIAENYDEGNCGIFNTRNIVGDEMTTLFDDDTVVVDICYGWAYFEVFGLSFDEWKEIEEFYRQLGE